MRSVTKLNISRVHKFDEILKHFFMPIGMLLIISPVKMANEECFSIHTI